MTKTMKIEWTPLYRSGNSCYYGTANGREFLAIDDGGRRGFQSYLTFERAAMLKLGAKAKFISKYAYAMGGLPEFVVVK